MAFAHNFNSTIKCRDYFNESSIYMILLFLNKLLIVSIVATIFLVMVLRNC